MECIGKGTIEIEKDSSLVGKNFMFYRGRPIEELSREELIEAIKFLSSLYMDNIKTQEKIDLIRGKK